MSEYFSLTFNWTSLAILAASFFFYLVVWRSISTRIIEYTRNTKYNWDYVVADAAVKPIGTLVLFWSVLFNLGHLLSDHFPDYLSHLSIVKSISLPLFTIWVMGRFVARAEAILVDKNLKDETTVRIAAKALRLGFFVISVILIMQALGFNLSGVMAFGGVGGLVVGLASKDLLSNLFGGLLIALDRPFKIGDWIVIPEKSVEGVVESIGYRVTVVRSFDKRPLYVPNALFASVIVSNPSRMTNRQISESIGVRYCDQSKVKDIVRDIKTHINNHEEIDTNQTVIVNLNEMAPSSMDIMVYCFTNTTEWGKFHEIKQDVMMQILDIIASHGAEVAFPTSTIHLESTEQHAASGSASS
ncbi:Mechanosensitive ion channel protein MscS [Vibrio chagasii]|nr:Mechanosensitive ion channel protein MscS [Vibrio chagasii]